MAETVLTAAEYADPRARTEAERIALSQLDCSRIEWHDVTGNDACRGWHEIDIDR